MLGSHHNISVVYSHVSYLVLHTGCYSVFIMLFSLFISAVDLTIIYMYMVSSARAVSPLHTHSLWSRSDDPGFARPDIGRLFLMCRCSMRRYALRGAWVLSLDSGILAFYSCYYSLIPVYHL